MNEEEHSKIKRLAEKHIKKGQPSAWFEEIYRDAKGNPEKVPWASLDIKSGFKQWLSRHPLNGKGKKALIVGCGLGDDAEAVSDMGFETIAFDISPTAIDWAKKRFSHSKVLYCIEDLFKAPMIWKERFDFILEIHTLQALPPEILDRAIESLASFLRAKGELLVFCRGREKAEKVEGPPWPLSKEQLEKFMECGLTEVEFIDKMDNEVPANRRVSVFYRK